MDQEKELLEQIISSMHRMKKIKYTNLFENLSQQEFMILQMIEHQKKEDKRGICVSRLAKQMRISPPAVSRKLKEMEDRNLVIRTVDREDRRNTYINLTEHGEQIRTDACHIMDSLFIRVIHNMGQENVEQMIQLWNQFGQEMEREAQKIKKGEADV